MTCPLPRRRMPGRGRLTALWVAALALAACAAPSPPEADGRLRVVATFTILADLARVVGGEHIALTVLVGPGQDAHTFEARPADSVALAQADLLLENGLGFEPWLDDLYAASGSQAQRVAVSDGLVPRRDPEGGVDPHVWQNVENARALAQAIGRALAAADPAHAADYAARTEAYAAELDSLDAWISSQVESLPAERRRLVTTHDTFGYFAERYGFQIVGTVLPSSTEGAAPSAQELARLVESVRASGVQAIFSDDVAPDGLLRQVAAEAGVRLVGGLHADALGPPGSGADTYLNMMRANVTLLAESLRP